MEKNEISGIPDHDVVVSPDDPDDPNDPVVSTDYVEKKREKTKLNRLRKQRPVQVKVDKRRNNNDLKSSFSKHEKHQPDDTTIEIEQFVASLKNTQESLSQCCIYKVPKDLRKIDRRFYDPHVISIGPFHHGKRVLRNMENQKLIYVSEFVRRDEGAKKWKEFEEFIKANKERIGNHYQKNSSDPLHPGFVNMILCDAVFIIEFFLKNWKPVKEREFDFFLDTPYVRAAITLDLQLLENQLPYFLLKELFEKGAFPEFTKKDYPDGDPFLILSHRFFNRKDGNFPKPNNQIQYEIHHFTDLIRYFLLMDFAPRGQKPGENEKKLEHVKGLPTATKLHGSGVKFKKGIEGGSSLKITCEYVPRAIQIPYFNSRKLTIPYFKACELQIPCIEIDDWSECLYRNLMALELCHYPYETHICNFILLMDFLINTEKDMDLLVDQGIIFSRLGDNATAATMFNNLSFQITPSHSVYHDICNKLKKHYDRRWNRTMATLNTVYFGDIWTGTKTVAAVILLVLTFIQTLYSIL